MRTLLGSGDGMSMIHIMCRHRSTRSTTVPRRRGAARQGRGVDDPYIPIAHPAYVYDTERDLRGRWVIRTVCLVAALVVVVVVATHSHLIPYTGYV